MTCLPVLSIFSHSYVSVGAPVATTVKVTLLPTFTDCEFGCFVIIGAVLRVSVAAELVTDPTAFITTTV